MNRRVLIPVAIGLGLALLLFLLLMRLNPASGMKQCCARYDRNLITGMRRCVEYRPCTKLDMWVMYGAVAAIVGLAGGALSHFVLRRRM